MGTRKTECVELVQENLVARVQDATKQVKTETEVRSILRLVASSELYQSELKKAVLALRKGAMNSAAHSMSKTIALVTLSLQNKNE